MDDRELEKRATEKDRCLAAAASRSSVSKSASSISPLVEQRLLFKDGTRGEGE